MQFVPESIIDLWSDQIGESATTAEAILEELNNQQPALLPFVLGENEAAFSQAERDFMVYLLLVLWKSWRVIHGTQAAISPDTLAEAEEQNWEKLEAVQAKRFRDRLDVFFKDTKQEDLLAFLEDVLTDEEEEEAEDGQAITREGREPIFVLLKSVLDCLESL